MSSLIKGIDKKVSLADFGEPHFSICLTHTMLRKHNSNLVSTVIEKKIETITHTYNYRKIATLSKIEKNNWILLD